MQNNPVLGGPSSTLHIGLRELALFCKPRISIKVGWYKAKNRKGEKTNHQFTFNKAAKCEPKNTLNLLKLFII